MKKDRSETGKRGEQEACSYLESLGHTIVERNWRHSHKEVDIISVSGGNILHIVEVKSKTEPVVAEPELSVNGKKLQNLVAAAKGYLHSADKIKIPTELEVVFDVVTVVFSDNGTRIEYFPQAYIPIYA
ncbi:MAG: YraN family protein [Bacteroidales bacterium]|nr:YraN family protein [Bacteroidales bacterium]MBR3500022.1 YraN family protein [Bacteroidales bacterium]